jgi:hypothetical protein
MIDIQQLLPEVFGGRTEIDPPWGSEGGFIQTGTLVRRCFPI